MGLLELIVPVTIGVMALLNKTTSDAAKQEMDRNEDRGPKNEPQQDSNNNPGSRFLNAQEEYFLAALDNVIRNLYPNYSRYEILNNAVYYHNQLIIETRIYLSSGQIIYRSFHNSELWKVEYIQPETAEESEPEITEEERRALIIHDWMSKNVPTLTLKLNKAKASGIKQVNYDLPKLPGGLTEEEVSSILSELVPLFDWMITVENNRQISLKDVEVEDSEDDVPEDLFEEFDNAA